MVGHFHRLPRINTSAAIAPKITVTYVMEKVNKGEFVDPSLYYFRTAVLFETASEKYGWLNGILIMATIARRWRLRLTVGQKVELLPRSGLGSRYGMRMVCERR